jgi:hypothetical protein
MSWCDARGLRAFALCSLGCGWMVRAALQLESERWYVRAAAPEGGGLGELAGRDGAAVCRAGAPNVRHLESVEDIDFVSRGRQGRFGAVL